MAARERYHCDTNAERAVDLPQDKKRRRVRPGQKAPVNAPGKSRRRGQADEDESAAARGTSSFLPWGQRMERESDAWELRRGSDVETLIATLPQQVAGQAAWRQTTVLQKRSQLDSLEPLRCRKAADSSSCCQFRRTGSMDAVYYGVGGIVDSLHQPVFECTVHSCSDVTLHPLQFSCVPTKPVNNTKLVDVEVVEQFRLLQLKDGVGGHGAVCAIL